MQLTSIDKQLQRATTTRQELAVFCFHAITDEPLPVPNFCWIPRTTFVQQIEAIAQAYEVVPLEDALEQLWSGRLKRPTAAITFDDGFRNNLEVAAPVLRRYGLPATLFLCTGPVRSQVPLWFSRLHRGVCLTQKLSLQWQGIEYSLATVEDRARTSAALQEQIKQLSPTQVDAATDELTQLMEVGDVSLSGPDFAPLDPASIAAMARDSMWHFGAHTKTHALLSRLQPKEQRSEIAASLRDIAEWSGRTPTLFAYPNGRPQDLTLETERIASELGIHAAFTTSECKASSNDSRLRLPRLMLGPEYWEDRLQ